VNPGDIVMGDLNGIVVIPQLIAGDMLASLRAKAAGEAGYTEAVARGDFSNAWVDRLLEQSGMPIESDSDVGQTPASL